MDSSEPVLNFLGRGEFMAKPLFRTSIFGTPTSGYGAKLGLGARRPKFRRSPAGTRRSYSSNYGLATSLRNQHPSG